MGEEDRVYDPKMGEESLDKLMPHLKEIKKSDLEPLNLDLLAVALVVLDVADFISHPEIREHFKKVPEDFFDFIHVEKLADLGWAAWHVKLRYLSSTSSVSNAKLPVDFVEESTQRKNRMLKCCDYYLSDVPLADAEIASIKAGMGYLDLASDLARLALLYKKHKEVLRFDRKYYEESDIDEAKANSAEIMKLLGRGGKYGETNWSEMQARVWTLLKRSYDEVQMTGQYIFRHDARAERFPSLFVASRARRRAARKAKQSTQTPPEPEESSTDTNSSETTPE